MIRDTVNYLDEKINNDTKQKVCKSLIKAIKYKK